MPHHDLVIIGSGSGNSIVTPELEGRDIAIIEGAERFGGTCLNVGCIPTKMFVLPADRALEAATGEELGVHTRVDGVDWPAIRDRIFGRIDPISASGEEYRRDGTTLYRGWARFTGERRLVVDLESGPVEVTADEIVVAAGSRATVPPPLADAAEREGITLHTSDTVMRIPSLPRRVLIVGGGYIAAEMAHVFSSFGSQVTLVVRGSRLLTHVDEHISRAYTHLAEQRWDLRVETQVDDLTLDPDDGREITARLSDATEVVADLVLVATGRRPNGDRLDVHAAGIETEDDGRVRADEHGRTTADGVWTLGDVSSPFMLKHVANAEARVVAHNLAHPDDLRTFDHDHVPAAIFTHPQIATVGMTLEQALDAGYEATSYTQRYGDTAWGWALEDTEGVCTVVACTRTEELLGAHLMGEQAATLIQPLVQAMSTGQRVSDIARQAYWIHPAPTEVVENALLGLDLNPPGDLTESPPDA